MCYENYHLRNKIERLVNEQPPNSKILLYLWCEFINESNDLDNITIKNPKRADAILEQAKRQIRAVGGNVEIEWHVSTELGAKGIQKLFKTQDPPIKIDVKYIKQL